MIELNSAVATWLATYFVHSTLLLGGTSLAIRLFAPSLPIEETLWKCALLLGILSSAVAVAGSRGAAPVTSAVALATPVLEPPRAIAAPRSSVDRGPEVVIRSAISIPRADWMKVTAFFPMVWFAGMFIGLSFILMGQRRLLRSVGRRKLVTDTELLLDLSHVRDAAGFAKPLCLTSSRQLISPLAIGSVEIAVSEEVMSSLTRAQRVSVLAHEMSHLMRRDPLWRVVTSIINAVFFFQPLNRLATRRMREIAEFLADGAAGRNGHHIALAECLTNIAGRISKSNQYAVALTGTPSMLLRRVQRLLAMAEYPQPRIVSRLAAVAPLVLIFGLAPDVDFRPHRPADVAASDSAAQDHRFQERIVNDTELMYTNDHNGNARERIILRAHRVVTGSDGSLEGVLPGGRLEIITTGGRVTHHRVLLERDRSGTLSRTYWREGVAAPFDRGAHEWMTSAFTRVFAWSKSVSQASGEPDRASRAMSH